MAHCVRVELPGGAVALVRVDGPAGPRPCVVCGGIGTKQCDYPRKPKPSRARCNAYMCATDSVNVGPDLDWCTPCAEADAIAGAA